MAKTYHHGDLREALIAKTLEMIQKNESHLIGFRELARRLNVSRTAPYRHFESIENLLSVVVEEGFQNFIEALTPVVEDITLSDKARFMQIGIVYIDFAVKHSTHYQLMFDQRFFQKGEFKQVENLAKKAFELLRQTAAACLDSEASKQESYERAHLAWASVHGISKLIIDGQWNYMRDRQKFIRYSCERLLALCESSKSSAKEPI